MAPPKYQRVMTGIHTMIDSGALKPGDKLPSTKMLLELFKVSYGTLHTGLVLLRAEGTIEGQQGEYRYVTKKEAS